MSAGEPAPEAPSTSEDGFRGRRCRTAVLVGPGPRVAGHDDFAALIPILGRSPLQRHAVQLARSGVERCVVVLERGEAGAGVDDGSDLETRCLRQIDQVPTGDMAVEVAGSGHPLGGGFDPTSDPSSGQGLGPSSDPGFDHQGRPVLRVRAEGVYDPRLYSRLLESAGPAWLADRADSDEDGGGELQPLGMALATPESPGRPDPDESRIGIDDIPPYLPSMRRTLRPYWCLVTGPDEVKRAAGMILDATQKGVLDFPARYLHPAPENFLTRLFAPTPVTPNQITVVTGVIGFAAAWLFAAGHHGPALAMALLVNILDGVDGKLARVKLLTSRFGDRLDHILDVLFEFAWYLGIGYGLSGGSVSGAPFRLAVGLIAVMLGNRAVSGVYKLVSGRQIHDHRAFDRAVRLVAGRRNIYVVTLVVGFLAGRFSQAFTLCFAWAVLTLAVYVVRTAVEAVADFDRGAERAP